MAHVVVMGGMNRNQMMAPGSQNAGTAAGSSEGSLCAAPTALKVAALSR